MIKQKIFNRRTCALLLAVLLMLELVFVSPLITYAADEVTSFDETNIEDDLENVDLSNFPKNPLGESEIISVMEYAYSEHTYNAEHYGLYIYVYNPTGKAITTTGGLNKVNMRVGSSGDTEKVMLEYLDRTSDNLFYKFKLSNSLNLLAAAKSYAAEHNGVRRYEIIELEVRHGKDPETVEISCAYEWSGYAAYCDKDNKPYSTLECKNYGTRSIHLELLQTNYRFNSSYDGKNQDELNSVFFTISEEFFNDFGNLYQMSAEWYEYKTAPIFVTYDVNSYIGLYDYRNVVSDSCPYFVLWNGIDFSDKTHETTYYGSSFNALNKGDTWWPYALHDLTIKNPGSGSYGYILPEFDWLFYVEDSLATDGYVSKSAVKQYVEKYTNYFETQDKVRDKYSIALFSKPLYNSDTNSVLYELNSIDNDRLQYLEENRVKDSDGNYVFDENGNILWNNNVQSGYVKMTFTAGEDFDKGVGNSFLVADSDQSLWNEFWFGKKYESVTYSPIVSIAEPDLYLSEKNFSEKYYVNINDASNIMNNAKEAYLNGERPVLLRFAVTDYTSSKARFCYYDYENESADIPDENGYVAKETVFLDFDILSMKFQSEDGYTDVVIGVVCEPIDIINGLTAPEDEFNAEDIVAMFAILLLLIIVGVYVWPIISPFITMIWQIFFEAFKIGVRFIYWLLRLPFRIIAWFFY